MGKQAGRRGCERDVRQEPGTVQQCRTTLQPHSFLEMDEAGRCRSKNPRRARKKDHRRSWLRRQDEGRIHSGRRHAIRLRLVLACGRGRQDRRNFADESLEELTASIKEKGILQPILARPLPGNLDTYEIIAGERRWRAAQRAGLHEVPIVSFEADDRQALELAIIENVQRSDLNPLEEAAGYQRLGDEFGHSQADLAKIIGKSRSHLSNSLRLLNLPES